MTTNLQENKMAALESEGLKSTMTINKAIALMQDKHSSFMIQRHQRALQRIAQNNKSGYLLKDLFSLCHLLQECADRLHKTPEYEEPVRELIAIFSMPFLKERVSDESTYATNALEVFSLLGKLCKESSDGIRYEIATALSAFYEGKTNEELKIPVELEITQKTYNIVLVERSGIASSIALSLQLAQDVSTQVALLETLLLLSRSSVNSNHILSVGGASLVCEYLSTGNNEVVFLAVEVLWNLLEEGSQIQVSEQLSSLKSILILQKLMKELMLTSTSQQSKQLRNDVLMVVSLIASNCSNSPFVETGFLKDLCEYATFSEDEHQMTDTHKQLNLSHGWEDFELKKGLFCLLVRLRSLPAAIRVLSQQKVIRSLFSFVISNDTADTSWSSAQFEELQLLALSCLSLISPYCIEDYITCNGNSRLLLLIEWCNHETQFCGHGNSFHGKGGHGNKLAQLRFSLRLLLSMCSTKDDNVLHDLHEQGIIPVLIGLLKSLQKRSDLHDNWILLEIQSDALLVISCVCENNNHRKELFGGYEGVPVIIEYLKQDVNRFSSGLGHHRLFLAAADCTWSAVAGNNSVEDIFLEEGGIFVLMNLLQLCPKNMQRLVLGVLVDLCDNPKTASHITAWQGKRGVECWSLLAQLWRQEEKDLEVPRDVMGTVAGTTLPLVGAAQSAQGMPPLPTHQMSPAIEDISDNMRAKIYSFCIKIGFGYPSEGVTTENKITLCLIENYLDFKTGEVWYEVAGELAQEGLRPTTPDQECLQEILQCSEERAEEIIHQQHELIDEQHRQDLDEEYQYYEQLRDAQISLERAQGRRRKLEMRTSNYKHLKEAKQKQTTAIDASRPSAVSLGERFHTVNQLSLNVTAFCSRHVTVETTPMKLLTKNEIPIPKQSTTLSLTM